MIEERMEENMEVKSKLERKIRIGVNEDRIFDLFNMLFLIIITIIVFYPIYFVIIASISSPAAVSGGEVILIPKGNNLAGFQRVLNDSRLKIGYINSIVYTFVGVTINLAMTLISGYVLSRNDFKLRKVLTVLVTFTMFFGGGMIPRFIVIKNLGLLDTIWALVLPGAISTWNLIITRTFFQTTIPEELFDAASIDGCNHFKYFIRIVLPISGSIIAILSLYYGIGHWNSYGSALLYIHNAKKYPLQLVLRDILLKAQVTAEQMQAEDMNVSQAVLMSEIAESVKYVVVVASCLPIVILFPFMEKYFAKGVMIGSIKG